MKPEEFVEMAAGLPTSSEVEAGNGTPEADAVLDSLIGVARNLTAQALAPVDGVTVVGLFDDIGDKIMGMDRGSRVIARHRKQEAIVTGIEFRKNAVVLDIEDVATREDRECETT